MAIAWRVLLWTVVLVAPGGFLLVPVLAATSLSTPGARPQSLRERFFSVIAHARRVVVERARRATKR